MESLAKPGITWSRGLVWKSRWDHQGIKMTYQYMQIRKSMQLNQEDVDKLEQQYQSVKTIIENISSFSCK